NSMLLVGWQPVESEDQKTAFAALASDQIDAILAVGGQPLAWISELSRDYKLLEIPDRFAKQMDAAYDRATLSYRNLAQDGISTVSTMSLLVTRNYASAKRVEQLLSLRQCAADHLDDIRDTNGTHPKWQVIDPTKDSKWQMFKPSAPTQGRADSRG
ncbi:MAG TPA: hypothetical protein VN495_00280, partial [Candidatus Paceibacterota bacterium]|nr:hypothetical protein [Candidatus Paceibacterota bacterium]